MTLGQIKDYISKCKIASEQISNYVTEFKTAYEQIKTYIPKFDFMDKQLNNYIAKYQSDASNFNTEPSEEFKKYVTEYNISFEQLNNPMKKYIKIAKKLNTLLEDDTGTGTLFHIADCSTKTEQTSNKNAENETSLTDIEALFYKLNTRGKKEILKRLDELTHLKQYTDK